MKKLIILPLLALFITSCSTDDTDLFTEQQTADIISEESHARGGSMNTEGNEEPLMIVENCFNSANAEVFINYPGGFGSSAELTFVGHSQGADTRRTYQVSIEFESLVDCEDIEVGNGEVISYFVGNIMDPDLNSPSITLKPTDLPGNCYRWRYKFERSATRIYKACETYSQWYDAPLY